MLKDKKVYIGMSVALVDVVYLNIIEEVCILGKVILYEFLKLSPQWSHRINRGKNKCLKKWKES